MTRAGKESGRAKKDDKKADASGRSGKKKKAPKKVTPHPLPPATPVTGEAARGHTADPDVVERLAEKEKLERIERQLKELAEKEKDKEKETSITRIWKGLKSLSRRQKQQKKEKEKEEEREKEKKKEKEDNSGKKVADKSLARAQEVSQKKPERAANTPEKEKQAETPPETPPKDKDNALNNNYMALMNLPVESKPSGENLNVQKAESQERIANKVESKEKMEAAQKAESKEKVEAPNKESHEKLKKAESQEKVNAPSNFEMTQLQKSCKTAPENVGEARTHFPVQQSDAGNTRSPDAAK